MGCDNFPSALLVMVTCIHVCDFYDVQVAERQLREKEQERCDLQFKVRQTKETITSANATINRLEREMTLEKSLLSKSSPPETTTLPQYEDVSDLEAMTKELSPVTKACEAMASTAAETLHKMDYEVTSNTEHMGSTATALPASQKPVVVIIEPVSESEGQFVARKMTRDPSPLRLEVVSDLESDVEQSRNCICGQVGIDSFADLAVHQATPQSPMRLLSQAHSYSAAFDVHVTPTVPMPSPPHEPLDGKMEDSREKKVLNIKQSKRLKRRSASTSGKTTKQTSIQLSRQLSLPSSPNSPKRVSPLPTDQYFTILPSSSQSVTCSQSPAGSSSPLKALPFSTDDQPASSGDRLPEILTDLIASLNTEMMQSGALSPPTSLASASSLLDAPLTVLASSAHQEGDSGSNKVAGILSELVTYLTTETIQNTGMAVADSAAESSAESANHQLTDRETCDSPFSLLTGSEHADASDCEASAESETDEGPRERQERHGYQYIDVDSLFIPCSNPLFSIGEDEPPLFLLPRVACAEDFPLEVEPHCISRVALEAAQQGIIHAPPNKESSGGSGQRHKEGGPCLAKLSITDIEPCKCEESNTPLSAEENRGTGISQTPLTTKEKSLAHPTKPLPPTEQEQAPPSELHPSIPEPPSETLLSAKQVPSEFTRSQTPPAEPHPSTSKRLENVTKEPHQAKKSSTSVSQSTRSKTSQKSTTAAKPVNSGRKASNAVVGGVTIKVTKVTKGTVDVPPKKVLKVAKGLGGVTKKVVQGKKKKGNGRLHLQLEKHMARLEELKGHLASKSSLQPSTSITTGTNVASDAKASVTSGGEATKAGVHLVRKRKKSSSFGSVKKSAMSTTAADGEELVTCARTSAFVYVRKPLTSKFRKGSHGKNGKGTGSAEVSSTGRSPIGDQMSDIFDVVLAGTGTRPSSLDDLHTRLDKLWQSNQGLLLDTALELHPFTAPSIIGCSYTVPSCGLASAISRLSVTGKVNADVENLTKPKKHVTPSRLSSTDVQPSLQKSSFRPYSSPLLMFQSYRLNTLYRTNEKLALHSLSHSNKINPNRIMCRFELGGICNDPSCTGQHFRDIRLNKEELIQDLVSYAPQLAGCTVSTSDSENSAELHVQGETETAKEMIASYASQMVSRYSSKVPDEDLFKLTVHDVNKERAKLKSDPKANASYISFDDRTWLASKGESSNPISVKHPISLLAKESVTNQPGDGEKTEMGMEWDDISKELMPLLGYGHEARYV